MVCLADSRMAPQPQFGPLACDSSDTGGFAAARIAHEMLLPVPLE